MNQKEDKELIEIVDNHIINAKDIDYCEQRCMQYQFPHASKKWWKPICYHIYQVIMYYLKQK